MKRIYVSGDALNIPCYILTWISKIEAELTRTPYSFSNTWANRNLFSCFTLTMLRWNTGSFAHFFNCSSCSRWTVHSLPIFYKLFLKIIQNFIRTKDIQVIQAIQVIQDIQAIKIMLHIFKYSLLQLYRTDLDCRVTAIFSVWYRLSCFEISPVLVHKSLGSWQKKSKLNILFFSKHC